MGTVANGHPQPLNHSCLRIRWLYNEDQIPTRSECRHKTSLEVPQHYCPNLGCPNLTATSTSKRNTEFEQCLTVPTGIHFHLVSEFMLSYKTLQFQTQEEQNADIPDLTQRIQEG